MSATPYFTALSKYPDGQPFPWIVSDFGLADAVECGIVKIPRVPKGDDSGESEPRYLHLWEHVKDKLSAKALGGEATETELMKGLMAAEGAMRALTHHWNRTFETWTADKSPVPPCMIVVCNNTNSAAFIERFIAKGTCTRPSRTRRARSGRSASTRPSCVGPRAATRARRRRRCGRRCRPSARRAGRAAASAA
ncbi:MAG: hypothetical protein IPF99_33545 [Deltaproteobacteria bacterium]|nr:hypothetical protein [Deltaproteobacteria bacterium]